MREKRKKQAESSGRPAATTCRRPTPTYPVISVGDYNAFQFSERLRRLASASSRAPDPDDQIVVDAEPRPRQPGLRQPDRTRSRPTERYSFIFEGTPQALDHVTSSTARRARATRASPSRASTRTSPRIRPRTYASNAAIPERNSDHDPVVSYYSLAEGQSAGTLIISEFRFHGQNFSEETTKPTGGGGDDPGSPNAPGTTAENDEFIEFYNNTDADITVSTIDGSPGWALVASDGAVRFIIPNGTVIPARHHFLAANTDGYSLSDYGLPDSVLLPDGVTPASGYNIDILDESGIALFRTANSDFFTAAERLDAAGYTSVPELYREGDGLPVGAEVGSELEHAWVRKVCAPNGGCAELGLPRDTGDNAPDFISVDTTGVTQSLGAPGPEGLTSPIQRNAEFSSTLLDTSSPQAGRPTASAT